MVNTVPVILNMVYDKDNKALRIASTGGGGGVASDVNIYYYTGTDWVAWQRGVKIIQDDVGLSLESTQQEIKTQVNKLTFDASNYLYVNVSNFPSEFPLPSAQITSLQNIRNLASSSDEIKIYYPDESERILKADDAVTTINYSDSTKETVTSITTSSSTLGRKVTDTFADGTTSLTITRVVSNV